MTSSSASDLVEKRLGLATTTYFRNDFPQLLEQLSAGNIPEFTDTLQSSDEFSRSWQAVIQSLAIGETYFFRDQTHFRLLKEKILPEMIQTRRMRGERHLNIWSVGCATGEEPYSIAMMLYDMLPDYEQWSIQLIGSDLNANALEAARRAVYRPWSFRQTDDNIHRYFDAVDGGLRVKPEIRRMVTFRQANVLKAPPVPQFDVVMCRNVMLYFTPQCVQAMENLLHDVLFAGGWLLLGQSETLKHGRDGWITHIFPGAPIYQKANTRNESATREHIATPNPNKVKTAPLHQSLPESEAPTRPISSSFKRNSSSLKSSEYELALYALKNDQSEQAQMLITRILKQDPNNAPAHVLMAVCQADRKQTTEAHRHLDLALHIDPLLADGHYLRGVMYYEANQFDKAKKAFQYTLYCQRHHPLASFTLGILMAQEGEIPRAIRHWENARRVITSLSPESPLSDLSDMTAGQLNTLIGAQLAGWE